MQRYNNLLTFFLLLLIALGLAYIPLLHLPFAWMETYFHELSHGLAAIFTGGSISRIELNFDGSGVCYTRGGWRFAVAFAGYTGAVIWGCALYFTAGGLSPKVARWLAGTLAFGVFLSAIFWVRNVNSLVIIIFIISIFILILRLRTLRFPQLLIQFSGMYVVLNAIRSPLYLLDGKHIGDGATLANITGIPEWIWIFLWCGFALASLLGLAWLAFIATINHSPRPLES